METPLDNTYTHKINNNDYIFKVTIVSAAGDATRTQDIKPSAIKSLIIDDTFTSFYQSGTIVIDNSFDVIERDTPNTVSYDDPQYYNSSGNTGSNIDAGFIFRGESRDILRVEIMPQLDSTHVEGMGSEESQAFFRILYDFAIYNSEDITGETPDQKYKKLYFWDLYYQLLLEKNVPFSTATIPSFYDSNGDINANNVPSGDAGIETGIALKEFLKAAFPDDEKYPVEFSENTPGLANSTDQVQTDVNNINWDVGGSKLFFSTPADFKAIDCINYILSRHVSNAASDFDQCFLHLERYPRKFSLKSVKQYFSQAYNPINDSPGSLYLETVKLGGFTNEDGKGAPEAYFTPTGGLYFQRIGTIKSFSFDNMAGIYSQQQLVPHIVHSYDNENKQFNMDVERHGIEQSMKAYQKNYVNNMNSSSEEPAYPNFAPGQLRYTNKNVKNVFSVSSQEPGQRLNLGRNTFLYNSVIMNNVVTFRLPGTTHRQAGFFIGIDRDGAIPASKFDNKLLGIYMIVEVKHIFQGNEYYNDLHCIKTYNFRQLDDTVDSGDLKGLVSNGA
jgi:hypothetical protein